MSQSENSSRPLEKLSDAGLALADKSQDIRRRKVVDADGAEIGHVSHLFIDAEERKVRMIEVAAGGFLGLGDRHFLLPVDAIVSVGDHEVRVCETRERVVGSPAYDPTLIKAPTPKHLDIFYGYYDLAPYWSAGYMYPSFPHRETDEEKRRAESLGP
jgi:sporulation protein YlmC with PRC-barrel domain